MEQELLELVKNQQETIRLLSMELAGITNALGSVLVQQMNPVETTPQRLHLQEALNESEDELPSSAAGIL